MRLGKKTNKIFIFLFVIYIMLYCFSIFYTDKQFEGDYKHFYESNLDGIIESTSTKHHGVAIKLKDHSQEYVFHPNTSNSLNRGSIFHLTAQKGDRIIKKAYSDTLSLISNKDLLRYTFDSP